MDHLKEDLIWKYLDNQCSQEELGKIRNLMESDPQLLQEIESARLLHETLNETSIVNAPVDLSTKVLSQLSAEKKLNHYPGIGISPLIIFLSGLTFIIIYTWQQYQIKSIAIEKIFDSYISLPIPDINWTLPTFGQTGLYLAIALLAIPFLYFLDKIIIKNKVSNLGVLMLP